MAQPDRNRIAVVLTVAATDALLAAYFVLLAVSNLSTAFWSDSPLFSCFHIALSVATPAFLVTAARSLVSNVTRTYLTAWQIALLAQRLVCWTIVLQAVALLGMSLVLPNESFSATIPFVTGVAYLLLALVAGAACIFLGNLIPWDGERGLNSPR